MLIEKMVHTDIDIEKKYGKMKQDVYEHLAKTFLDKKKKKDLPRRSLQNLIIFAFFVCVLLLLSFRFTGIGKNIFGKSIYVISDKAPIIIEYDFTALGSTKTRILSVDLNNINLSGYKFLNLSIRSVKKTNTDSIIKVQIENSLLEKDAQYLSGINGKWDKFSLFLKDFKLISDWASIKSLSFIIEDWNVSNKKDKICVDDVRFSERKFLK